MKNNILFIIPGGIGSGINGSSIPIIQDLIDGIAERNQVTVISLSKVHESFKSESYDIYDIGLEHGANFIFKSYMLFKLIWSLPKKQKFEIIHGIWTMPSGFYAVILGKILNCKSVVSLQGGCMANITKGSFNYGGNRGAIKRIFNYWTLKNSDLVTAESNFQKNLIHKLDIARRIKVIYNGRNGTDYKIKNSFRNQIEFVHVANITPVKDQETLVRCFRLILRKNNCHLTIIGPDYYDGYIQKIVEELGISDSVTFAGHLSNKEVIRILRESDIMLHTSIFEASAIAILEAMICGVVVSGTNVGLLSDLGDDYFVTAEVGDYVGLADKVCQLIADQNKYDQLRNKSYDWICNHSMDRTIDMFNDNYNILSS